MLGFETEGAVVADFFQAGVDTSSLARILKRGSRVDLHFISNAKPRPMMHEKWMHEKWERVVSRGADRASRGDASESSSFISRHGVGSRLGCIFWTQPSGNQISRFFGQFFGRFVVELIGGNHFEYLHRYGVAALKHETAFG